MLTNKDLIRDHLEKHLIETHQWGNATWHHAMGFCIGYYAGQISTDHIMAIMDLEESGAILKG